MKQIVRMSIDVELELDCGEMRRIDFTEANKKLGYTAFDEKGVPTQEAIEKEKYVYSEGIKEELENLDYNVNKIYNVEVRFK